MDYALAGNKVWEMILIGLPCQVLHLPEREMLLDQKPITLWGVQVIALVTAMRLISLNCNIRYIPHGLELVHKKIR